MRIDTGLEDFVSVYCFEHARLTRKDDKWFITLGDWPLDHVWLIRSADTENQSPKMGAVQPRVQIHTAPAWT